MGAYTFGSRRSRHMPEGHTIHRLALDHQQELAGDVLAVSSPQGRHTHLAAVLDGHVLERVEAHGKHLFYDWLDAPSLHVHLGLVGRFRQHRSPPPPASSTVQLRLEGRRAAVDLVGATTCELVNQSGRELILARLGPDLLADEDTPERAWTRLSHRSVPIAAALLDQRNLSGVGNVYRSEALFLNAIHPERPASSLTRAEFDRLWATLRTLLRQGVEDRRIVTVHPSERSSGGDGLADVGPEDSFYVYKQQRCRRCGTPIHVWPLAGRRVYACELCQPPPARPDRERGRPSILRPE
jgi:endonuclease VIII